MTNDVQNRERLSTQWNVEHVQSNDTIKFVSAWNCSLSRKAVVSCVRHILHNGIHVGHIRALQVLRELLSTLLETLSSVDVPGFDDTNSPS